MFGTAQSSGGLALSSPRCGAREVTKEVFHFHQPFLVGDTKFGQGLYEEVEDEGGLTVLKTAMWGLDAALSDAAAQRWARLRDVIPLERRNTQGHNSAMYSPRQPYTLRPI